MIGNLIRNTGIIGPGDAIGRAAEYMRSSGLTELPVVSNYRVMGLVKESAVICALADGDPIEISGHPVSTILNEASVCANPFMSVDQVAEMMKDHDIQVAPVVDTYGNYLGIITRRDVLSVLMQTLRPPVIGGMATPLGVYLTSGSYRAGAGDLGLFLSGAMLVLMNFASVWIVTGGVWLIDHFTRLPMMAILNSPPTNTFHWMDILGYVLRALPILIFFFLFRILPLSGYHAAEHQVVNAIEHGEPLKPANVAVMPRVHPRCGTNLIAAVILFMTVSSAFSSDVAIMIALFVLIFAWRNIGGFFQYYITTKAPNSRQIANGIKTGQSLLEQFRENPGFQVTQKQRIWNTGMPQAMIGALVAALIMQLLHIAPMGLF